MITETSDELPPALPQPEVTVPSEHVGTSDRLATEVSSGLGGLALVGLGARWILKEGLSANALGLAAVTVGGLALGVAHRLHQTNKAEKKHYRAMFFDHSQN